MGGHEGAATSQTYSWVVTPAQPCTVPPSHPLPSGHLSGIPAHHHGTAVQGLRLLWGTGFHGPISTRRLGQLCMRPGCSSRARMLFSGRIGVQVFTHSCLKQALVSWQLFSESRGSLKSCRDLKRIVHEKSSIWRYQAQGERPR